MMPDFQYLYLHAPEPPRQRPAKEDKEQSEYPDYEQSYIFEERVVVIQL